MRRVPGGDLVVKGGVFALGLVFIALGFALVVLPGPLTIPPVLLGLYVWTLEFDWADRLMTRAKASAGTAWEAAKKHPWRTGAVTASGFVLAGAAFWSVHHYDLVRRLHDSIT